MNRSTDLQNPHDSAGGSPILAQTATNGSPSTADFLAKIVGIFEAQAGILWAADGDFRVVATHTRNDSPLTVQMRQEEHEKILRKTAESGNPSVLQTRYGNSDQANLLVVGKFESGKVPYLVELIIEDHRLDKAALHDLERRFRDCLLLMAASEPLFRGTPRSADQVPSSPTSISGLRAPAGNEAQAISEDLNAILQRIHSSTELPLTAANVANECRRFLNYDRVSVLVERNGKQRLVAISGQASVNRRSNTTQLLEQLAAAALRTGRSLWYPNSDDLPSKIATALNDYVQVSTTRSMAIVPLQKQPPTPGGDQDHSGSPVLVGGIVFEKFQERWERSVDESRIAGLLPHVSNAIANSLVHQKIFLYPLWRFLGRSQALTQPKYLSKTLIGLSLATALLLALILWPVRFYVSADGILIPSSYQPVFSSMSGEIEEVLVKHGDRVQKGQKLARLSSREHEFRVEELESQLKTAQQRLASVEDQRHNPARNHTPAEIEENIVSLRTQIENLEAQRSILQKITDQQIVYSPMDGQVITWDLHRQLANRVVNSGVRLMEIADNSGEWLIEIDLPIRRQGHLARALANGDTEDLKVTFLLAADPSKQYVGHVVEIANSVSISDDNRQVIKVLAAIEDSDITIDQVRSSVSAKVYCGQSSLGYLWFHDIWEFIQKRVLFPLL